MTPNETDLTQSSEIQERRTPEMVYANQRRDWDEKIRNMAEGLRNIMNIASVQIDLFSNRHLAVDQIHSLLNIHIKVNEKYKIARGDVRKNLEGLDNSMKVRDITEQVDARTIHIKTALDQVANQIDFFREVIKTIDQMLYGIKYRLDYETNYNRMS